MTSPTEPHGIDLKGVKIAILDDYQAVAREVADWSRLEEAGAEITVFREHLGHDDAAVAAALEPYDVIVAMRERTPLNAARLERLPKLKLIVSTGRRNASIDLKATAARSLLVCGTGYLPAPAAEHTWALIHAATRRLDAELGTGGSGWTHDGGWQTTVGRGLEGRRLGLLGLGNLGERVARVGLAFGMEVVAWSQNLTDERAAEVGVRRVEKAELFSGSDIVSVHLVLSKRSRGLVGAAELALMKPEAILVNTSRAPIVDQDALVDALTAGRIGGAALDVYDVEPLPADHPLRTAPRTFLTPHIGYVTREQFEVFYRDAVEDIEAWAAGSPVRIMELPPK